MSLERRTDATEADLIRPLSVEAVIYFADTVLFGRGWEKNDTKKFQTGKFVRMGDEIFLGSSVEYGSQYRRLGHVHIAHYALGYLGYARCEQMRNEIAGRTYDATVLDATGLMLDAGSFMVDNQEHSLLYLNGSSADFGRADAEGRRMTEERARFMLGNEVRLIVSD